MWKIVTIIKVIGAVILYLRVSSGIYLCDLSRRNITELHYKEIQNCDRHAKVLNLAGNRLRTISNTSFSEDEVPYFYRLKDLDLSNNLISSLHVDSFLKLPFLEVLNLSGNYLHHVENGVLNDKMNLISLDLSHNEIENIGGEVFTREHYDLHYVNISFNKMSYFEPWPYLPPSPVSFNLSYNNISKFTNRMNWTYDRKEPYTTEADLRYNKFRHWDKISFQQYSTEGGDYLAQFVTYNIDIQDNPWVCDCNFHSFVRQYRNSFFRYASSSFSQVKCIDPPNLRGSLLFVNVSLDDLICNRTKNCPSDCLCQDLPERKILQVNCKHGNHTALPVTLPENEYGRISLLLDDNKIDTLRLTNYTSMLVNLSLAQNVIGLIEQNALNQMSQVKYLNLENNKLKQLPNNMQFILQYQNVFLQNNPLVCNCDMVWMSDWIKNAPAHSNTRDVECIYSAEKYYRIRDITLHLLNCTYDVLIGLAVVFGVILTLVITTAIWAKRCPYETKVLVYKFFRYHPRDRYEADGQECMTHDVYISFDDDDTFVRQWVARRLVRKLEDSKPFHRVFVPLRDLHVGQWKAPEIVEQMEKSKRILIILSEKYENNEWCQYECQCADILKYNEGRILYAIYHESANSLIEREPWKSRMKNRRVVPLGKTPREHKWFMDKLRYELPVS